MIISLRVEIFFLRSYLTDYNIAPFLCLAFHKEEQLLSHMSVHLKSYNAEDDDMSIHDIQDDSMGIPILVSVQ